MAMSNYTIIADYGILVDFIRSLPELEPDLKYYVCLFARSKYLTDEQRGGISHIKSDKAQLKRVVATKHNLLTKLQQMECPLGSYIQYKTNVPHNPIPQESIAVYMTINPRSLQKATRNSLKKFVDMVVDNPQDPFNPSNFAMSEIQRSRGRTDWVIFDIDNKDIEKDEIIKMVGDTVGPEAFKILETRGGYHVLISPGHSPRDFYQKMQKTFDIDQAGDIMIPIPGTYQGGHVPKFI